MQGLAPCSVVDLVSATCAGGADHGARARADGWQDCLLGDLHGEVVALFGKSEAAGQAAAARLQDFKLRAEVSTQDRRAGFRAPQCFLVAMGVQGKFAGVEGRLRGARWVRVPLLL